MFGGKSIAVIGALSAGLLVSGARVKADIVVPGDSDLWLAGQTSGSATGDPADTVPAESPVQVTGIPLTAGDILTFSIDNGPGLVNLVNYEGLSPLPGYGPDGDAGLYYTHDAGLANGISDVYLPISSLIGVFLPGGQMPAPAPLNFSTGTVTSSDNLDLGAGGLTDYASFGSGLGIDFSSLSPALGQPFFIGDGLTGTGSGTVQDFIVPAGATSFYLGTMDGTEWAGDKGQFYVDVAEVPVPAAVWPGLVTLGLMAAAWRARRLPA